MGTTVNLMCGATGANNLMYQWMRKGKMNIPSQATGANTRTLVIHNISLDDSGEYKCAVSSNGITVSSDYGTVSVFSEILTSI